MSPSVHDARPEPTDELLLEKARACLAADQFWQTRVHGVQLLGRTDPTSDAGRVATELLRDICVNHSLVQAIEEAGFVLMTGGALRVEAYLRAWDDAEGVVAGWMDNCLARLDDLERGDEYVAERQEHAHDPWVRAMAQEWREFHGYPTDPHEPLPPFRRPEGLAAAGGASSENHSCERVAPGQATTPGVTSSDGPQPPNGLTASDAHDRPRPRASSASGFEIALGNVERMLVDAGTQPERLEEIRAHIAWLEHHRSTREQRPTDEPASASAHPQQPGETPCKPSS